MRVQDFTAVLPLKLYNVNINCKQEKFQNLMLSVPFANVANE